MHDPRDPFQKARNETGLLNVDCDGETVPLILRLKDLRKTAKDWHTFSNDLAPMIVLHSEAHVRDVRQLPIECDPPDHTEYRALVEPVFRRPTEPDYMESIASLVEDMVQAALDLGEMEAVRGFALPLQSRALAKLLNMPDAEADVWIRWGVHVFHDRDDDAGEGFLLQNYTAGQFARAEKEPGNDVFSYLNQVEFRGRKLTLEEKQGFANVIFAGGRDTIINTVSSIFAYLGEHPEALAFLREDETRITTACEEFVRYVSPLTAIARKCPHATRVLDQQDVPAGNRVALCWPSANRDETIFDHPEELRLDRKPNPHVGFGSGTHNCLGAAHARLLIRSLLASLSRHVERVELVEATPKMEEESSFTRQVGYEAVRVRLVTRMPVS
jgi:cytochrome P450